MKVEKTHVKPPGGNPSGQTGEAGLYRLLLKGGWITPIGNCSGIIFPNTLDVLPYSAH